MPELTPGLGLKKPLANEAVARQSFNENWDIIDASVAVAKTEIENHIANTNNPHNITSALIGAVNNTEVDQASTSNKIVRRDSSGNVKAQQLISEAAQGVHPMVVVSTTMVNNLNAEMVGGKKASDFVQQIEIGTGSNQIPRLDSFGKLPTSVLPDGTVSDGDGDGVTALVDQYDAYNMWMTQYYTGEFTASDIASMKYMTFDGFTDTSRVDAGASTAVVDIINNYIKATGNIAYVIPTTAENISGSNYGLTDNGSGSIYNDFSNLNNMIDGNDSTYAETYQTSSGTRYVVSKHDLGSIKFIKTVKVKAVSFGPSGTEKFNKLSYSTDGTNWTVVTIEAGLTWDVNDPEAWVEYVFDLPVNARYIAIEWYWSTASTGSNNGIRVYTVNFGEYTYIDSIFYTATKPLTFAAKSAKLFLTASKSTGTDIIPLLSVDNGITYENLTLVSQRADPKDPNYNEYEYKLDFATGGNNLKFKAELTTTDGTITPKIKRYGIFITDAKAITSGELVETVDNLAYDTYDMYMDLYYTGHFSGPPMVGMKAMDSDGFIDSSNIDGDSTGTLNTANKRYSALRYSNVSWVDLALRSGGISDDNVLGQDITFDKPVKLSGFVVKLQGGADGTKAAIVRVSDGMVLWQSAEAANTYDPANENASWTFNPITVPANTTIRIQVYTYTHWTRITSSEQSTHTLIDECNITYGAAYYNNSTTDATTLITNGTISPFIAGLIASPTSYDNSILLNTGKTLDFSAQSAKLYISVKEPTGTSVTPRIKSDDTVGFQNLTFVSSRPDPKFAGYTEKEYSVNFITPGVNYQLQAELTASADKTVGPELKRYGVHLT